MLELIKNFDERHPYATSSIIASAIVLLALFYTPSIHTLDDFKPPAKLDIVNIDTIQAPKRVVKKEVSTEEGDVNESSQVERAKGTSDASDAIDLSFYPNIAPPKPIGRLMKIYPKNAKQQNIEATLFVAIVIDRNGKVNKVNIIGTRLNKDLPPEAHSQVSREFARAAIQILSRARFTPTIYNGKKVPIKMELPLKFRLDS